MSQRKLLDAMNITRQPLTIKIMDAVFKTTSFESCGSLRKRVRLNWHRKFENNQSIKNKQSDQSRSDSPKKENRKPKANIIVYTISVFIFITKQLTVAKQKNSVKKEIFLLRIWKRIF